MQSIPQDFIEEVIARTDLVALISVVVPLKRSGKNYSACCPFHEERTPSFTVSPEKQFYYCFGCGASGNAIRFLMEHQHLGFVESLEALALRAGLPMPQTSSADDAKQRHQRQRLTHLLEQAATFFNQQLAGPSGAQARDYLNARGLTPKIWKQFGLGWAPNQWQHFLNTQAVEQHSTLEAAGLIIAHEKRGYYERFRGRLMFPIRDHRGKIIGFGGRVLDDTKPKYLNSPETAVFHKQQSLFGLHEWTHAKPKPTSAVLVEGYTDVIALHQAGLHQALATLGTACSTHHLNLIFQRTDTLYFCFDGDDAGHKAALRALETALPLLRDGRHIFFLQLPDGEDPDSLVQHQGPGGFIALMESAQPLSEFLLQHLTQKHRLDNVDDRAALIAEAKPFFEKVPESLYRSLLFEALAERTHINPSVLSSALLPSSAPTNHSAAQAPYAPYENNDNAHRAPTHSTPPLGPHDFSWPLNPGEPPIEHWKNQKRFANNKTGSITQQKPSWPSKQQARHKQFPPT
ncbi:MAG: DNA primase, partial [Gammaproteobacteria bacterium]